MSGALLVIGIRHGSATPEGKDKTYEVVREFTRRFEQKHSSLICRQLIDCDISTPEGLQAAKDKRVFTSICPGLVQDAVEITAALVK